MNNNEFGFLPVEHPVISFYLLPKVYKEPKD